MKPIDPASWWMDNVMYRPFEWPTGHNWPVLIRVLYFFPACCLVMALMVIGCPLLFISIIADAVSEWK